MTTPPGKQRYGWTRKTMTGPIDITGLLTAASESAKLANLNAEQFGKTLNAIRNRAAGSPYDLWDAFDAEIGKAGPGAAQSILVEARRDFEEQLISQTIEDVTAAFGQSAEQGSREWICALAGSISEMRLTVAMRLVKLDFEFPEGWKKTSEQMKLTVPKISRRLWSEVTGLVSELTEMEFIGNVLRARLMVFLAAIQDANADGKHLLEAAEKLAPNDCRVLSAVGDSLLKQKDFEKAEAYFERAVQQSPLKASGYTGLGDCYRDQDQPKAAEDWYKKAIANAASDAQGYIQLMQFYGRPEMFATHQGAIADLAERCVAVAPEEGFMTYLDVVDIYRKNRQYETALQWYEKAETLSLSALRADKEYPWPKDGLELLAEDHRLHNDFEHADWIYKSIFEIVGQPYLADYHNRLGNLEFDRRDYQSARDHYRRAIEARQSEAVFHSNLAIAYRELEQYEQAQEELRIALSLDKDEAAYRKAMALVANAQGNDFYSSSDYEKAIQCYRQAIGFDDSDPVFHSNLAGAWEYREEKGQRIANIENAIHEYESAHALKPDGRYDLHVQRLQRKKAFSEIYGEESLDWKPLVTPIAVEVAKNLIPYFEGTQGNLSAELAKCVDAMRARMLAEFGVRSPGIRFRGNEAGLEEGTYVILLMEIPLVMGAVSVNKKFYPGPAASLETLGIAGEAAVNPVTGDNGYWVSEGDWSHAEAKQLELWSAIEYLVRHLEVILRQNLMELVGHQETAEIFEGAVQGLTLDPEKLSTLTAVCRGLLTEQAPIGPHEAIYRKFDELYGEGCARRDIVERIRLLPEVRSKLWDPQRYKTVLSAGPVFEAVIRSSIYDNHAHPVLAMKPDRCQDALTTVRNAIHGSEGPSLLVEDAELRPFVRLLTEIEFPALAIFKRAELPSEVVARAVDQIAIENKQPEANQDFPAQGIESSIGIVTRKQTEPTQAQKVAPERNERPSITLFVGSLSYFEHGQTDPVSALLAEPNVAPKFFKMREELFYELGIIVPPIRLEHDASLPDNTFRFCLNEISLPAFEGLKPDQFLINDTVSRLKLLDIEANEAVNPADGSQCAIVQKKPDSDACERAGLTVWDSADYLVLALSAAVRRSAARFQTLLVTQFAVDSIRPSFPRLVDTLLSRFNIAQLNGVLQELLREEISIHNLRAIFEGLLSVNGTVDTDFSSFIVLSPHVDTLCPVSKPRALSKLTEAEYADVVRTSLKRYISHKYSQGTSALPVYLVDPGIEARLGKIDTEPLTEGENERLLKVVETETEGVHAGQVPILLTSFESRRALRHSLENKFPRLAVLSYQELSPDTSVQPIARISWE